MVTEQLLSEGYAVFALDAQNHGERASNIDYVPIPTLWFENSWWASFRDMLLETTADYRRALDYLSTRPELDLSRVAAVGQSMGGLTSLYLAAVEPRVSVVAAGAAALGQDWLYPLTPHNLATSIRDDRVLLVVGTEDELSQPAWAEALRTLVESPTSEMVYMESGHQLGPEYVPLMLDWIREHLR